MIVGDTHCDTLCRIADEGGNLFENDCHVSLCDMMGYDSYIQFFACFTDPSYGDSRTRFDSLVSVYRENMKKYESIARHCENYTDLEKAYTDKKIACFISVENCGFIKTAGEVKELRKMGVRVMSLVWNEDNHLASGAETEDDRGLTRAGVEVIKAMEQEGIFLDFSHMSDKTFEDALSVYKKPVIATHSNSRSVCSAKRNLTDEQFREIVKSGGYAGINLYPLFVTGSKNAAVSDILRHTDRFLTLGGEDCIGIGFDFDGVDCLPEGICGVRDVYKIFDEMAKIGYSSELIDKIAHKNLERVIKFF